MPKPRKLYGLTSNDRRAVRDVVKRVSGGKGVPSRRPPPQRRRRSSGGISAKVVILLENVPGATGTHDELTPESGEAELYVPHASTAGAYDHSSSLTVPYEWWGEEVTVTSGKGRLAYVIGRKLIPLCYEITVS